MPDSFFDRIVTKARDAAKYIVDNQGKSERGVGIITPEQDKFIQETTKKAMEKLGVKQHSYKLPFDPQGKVDPNFPSPVKPVFDAGDKLQSGIEDFAYPPGSTDIELDGPVTETEHMSHAQQALDRLDALTKGKRVEE